MHVRFQPKSLSCGSGKRRRDWTGEWLCVVERRWWWANEERMGGPESMLPVPPVPSLSLDGKLAQVSNGPNAGNGQPPWDVVGPSSINVQSLRPVQPCSVIRGICNSNWRVVVNAVRVDAVDLLFALSCVPIIVGHNG
jgi:hypothetical protein